MLCYVISLCYGGGFGREGEREGGREREGRGEREKEGEGEGEREKERKANRKNLNIEWSRKIIRTVTALSVLTHLHVYPGVSSERFLIWECRM